VATVTSHRGVWPSLTSELHNPTPTKSVSYCPARVQPPQTTLYYILCYISLTQLLLSNAARVIYYYSPYTRWNWGMVPYGGIGGVVKMAKLIEVELDPIRPKTAL